MFSWKDFQLKKLLVILSNLVKCMYDVNNIELFPRRRVNRKLVLSPKRENLQ